MHSAYKDSSSDQADGLNIGADGYIIRPIANKELLARVRSMIRLKRAETALKEAHAHLEERISERTAALEAANQTLKKEIQQRKQAEEELRDALAEVKYLKDRLQEENICLQKEINLEHHFDEIIGESDALKYVLYKVKQIAPTDTTALILGETGTGKELIARAIHSASRRSDHPLVKVNCAALPPSL